MAYKPQFVVRAFYKDKDVALQVARDYEGDVMPSDDVWRTILPTPNVDTLVRGLNKLKTKPLSIDVWDPHDPDCKFKSMEEFEKAAAERN